MRSSETARKSLSRSGGRDGRSWLQLGPTDSDLEKPKRRCTWDKNNNNKMSLKSRMAGVKWIHLAQGPVAAVVHTVMNFRVA